MLGLDWSSLYTFSGLLFIGAALMYVLNRQVFAAVLLIVAGAGGTAVAWDRWSERTGEQVHLTAFLNPAAPSAGEVTMIITHLPLLIVGLVLLAVSFRRANA
jgi:hypothetical protein